jgi:hypothetical protein
MLRRLKANAGRGPDAGGWFLVSPDTRPAATSCRHVLE